MIPALVRDGIATGKMSIVIMADGNLHSGLPYWSCTVPQTTAALV